MPGDPSLRRLLARDLGNLGEHAAALELWDALIAQDPQDTESLMGRVHVLVAQGNATHARKDTMALLELGRGGRVTLGPEGELKMRRGRIDRTKEEQ